MNPYPEKTSIMWWLVLPLTFFIFSAVTQIWVHDSTVNGLLMEGGPIELLQAFIIFLAFVAAVFTLPAAIARKNKFITAWAMLALIGTFYITGEEISWGQHIFEWQTPESWMTVNDHHETNLHNTSSWLDQKPRTLIEIGMLVGGILIPVYRSRKSSPFLDKYAMVLPPDYLWLTAVCLWITKIIKDIDGHFHFMSLTRTSEVNEIYMYYFMLIYLLAFRLRMKRWPSE